MITLLQRVKQASVSISNQKVAEIDVGLLVFVGFEKEDHTKIVDKLLNRVLTYRIFADETDKMNLNLQNIQGGLLLVPQFTLAAETKKGTRPSFSTAADSQTGERLFNYLIEIANKKHHPVECGVFGATMDVSLINWGPATFWLQAN